MELCLETGCTSLNHYGEELCGDNVACTVNGDYTTLVLADGLGSGVKANILSTLTSKILCTMAANEIDIYECVETIIQTLPVCAERGVAYSTFSIIHVNKEGKGNCSSLTIRKPSITITANARTLSVKSWMSAANGFIVPSSILKRTTLSLLCPTAPSTPASA